LVREKKGEAIVEARLLRRKADGLSPDAAGAGPPAAGGGGGEASDGGLLSMIVYHASESSKEVEDSLVLFGDG
jgi:hypothetical protein